MKQSTSIEILEYIEVFALTMLVDLQGIVKFKDAVDW